MYIFQVKDVNTHLLENRMESFFLAETTKYLYLLFDPDNFIHNNGSSGTVVQTPNGECVIDAGGYFFNTEAHPIDTAAVYCCSAAKKENDAILQSMHDNLDLLSLLNILDSTDNVIGEKLILKEKVENSKKEKLKGETGDMDPKKLRNYKVEQEVRTDSINKNTENKDKVKVEKMKNKSESTANKNNIQRESTTSKNNVETESTANKNNIQSESTANDQDKSENSKFEMENSELETKELENESTNNISKNNDSPVKKLTIISKDAKQTAQPNMNSLVQLLSVLSGKEITTDKQEVEWIPDVNHLYQVMQVYSNIYKIKPELMMCKAQPFHMRWSVSGEMFETEDV